MEHRALGKKKQRPGPSLPARTSDPTRRTGSGSPAVGRSASSSGVGAGSPAAGRPAPGSVTPAGIRAAGTGGGASGPEWALGAAFFLSGASSLIYELAWFRLLGHVFGSTATATATLLAAYFFGLGLGALFFGRISDRVARLPILYVAIEAAIGLYGLASHGLLQSGAALYAVTHGWAGGSPGRLLLTRFVISFVLIAVPTVLMGGTFPLMVHLLQRRGAALERAAEGGMATGFGEGRPRSIGRDAGRAYAINTAGAAAGALGLPLLLLPAFGVLASLITAALSNFVAALLAWSATRNGTLEFERGPRTAEPPPHAGQGPPEPAREEVNPAGVVSTEVGSATERVPPVVPGGPPPPGGPIPVHGEPSGPGHIALLVGFFLSSYASLALETAWARHLGIFFGGQIHTFAFLLCAYLSGLFAGGGLYARMRARGFEPASLLRAGLLLAAVTVGVTIPVLDRVSQPQIELMLAIGVSYGRFLLTCAIATIVLVLPPAVGFGLVFPAVIERVAGEGRRPGASVGLAYALSTLGTTLGAATAGFMLVPTFGTQRTFELSVLMIAAAIVLSWVPAADSPTSRLGRVAARCLLPSLFLILLVLPRWDWRFAHGMYSRDPIGFLSRYKSGALATTIAGSRIPYLSEGVEATVSVCIFADGRKSLFVNGKPDASNFPEDMVTQRLLGLVPPLFHQVPRRALVIGLGSGSTVAALGRFPLETIEVAEIAPEVAKAASLHFSDLNDRALEDRRVFLHLDDGRSYLHFRPDRSYDIIVSEPSNPWVAGVSSLFTDEFFQEARAKLRPGGVLCQWFHYYNMSLEHIRLLVRTFVRTFPNAALFIPRGEGPTGDILLIGANGPLRLWRLPEDATVPARVREALTEVKNGGSQQLLSGMVAGPAEIAAFAGEGPINTDDRPILEFEAPRDRFDSIFFENLARLLSATEHTDLPAGPSPEISPAEVEIARDGLSLARGLPAGVESRRGITVLTRVRPGGEDFSRWVLVGREFESGEEATGLYRFARAPQALHEIEEIAASLAGLAGLRKQGEAPVGGHSGTWALSESSRSRTLALGWFCPEQGRAYFLTRRGPTADTRPGEVVAADLAARFPCAHGAR